MNCINCNKEISDDSKFCPYCGKENTPSNHLKNKFHINLFLSLKSILILITIGIWILVFQNLGIIPITQDVIVVDFESGVRVQEPIDVNLQYINGESNVFFNNPSRGEKDKYYVIPVTVQ